MNHYFVYFLHFHNQIGVVYLTTVVLLTNSSIRPFPTAIEEYPNVLNRLHLSCIIKICLRTTLLSPPRRFVCGETDLTVSNGLKWRYHSACYIRFYFSHNTSSAASIRFRRPSDCVVWRKMGNNGELLQHNHICLLHQNNISCSHHYSILFSCSRVSFQISEPKTDLFFGR